VDCEAAREAISALLDGEPAGVDVAELERHLAACADCVAWREDAHAVTRRARVALAGSAPQADAALLAAVAQVRRERRPRIGQLALARAGLVAVALAQIAVTVPALILGTDHEAPMHVAHEMGSFDAALAIGFLAAAWRPANARGMELLVGAAALLLVVTAVVDLLAGRTSPADETPHLLAVAGWMLLHITARLEPSFGSSERASPIEWLGLRRRRAVPQPIAREQAQHRQLPGGSVARRVGAGRGNG